MFIVSEIESLFSALRAKVGTFTSDTEAHFNNFLNLAKSEEAAAEARVDAEIAHLKSLGYTVDKAADATDDPVPASTAVLAAPTAESLDAAAASEPTKVD